MALRPSVDQHAGAARDAHLPHFYRDTLLGIMREWKRFGHRPYRAIHLGWMHVFPDGRWWGPHEIVPTDVSLEEAAMRDLQVEAGKLSQAGRLTPEDRDFVANLSRRYNRVSVGEILRLADIVDTARSKSLWRQAGPRKQMMRNSFRG